MSCWAIIAAAGSGSRMGGDRVKTLQELGGRPVICYSVERLKRACDGVIIAVREQDIRAFQHALAGYDLPEDAFVVGGSDRRSSVHRALSRLPEDCDLVLVHDAARPLVSRTLIDRVIDHARRLGSAVPAEPITDTVKRVDQQGRSIETLQRTVLRTVQTPQGFHRTLLESAYEEVEGPASDDASLVEQLDLPVHLVDGEPDNIKLTLPGDLERAEEILAAHRMPRVGLGYDAHRLEKGRPLILGGVEIPFDRGLMGHSDADVAVHALIDALLGAACLGDIGQHFPDTDTAYAGASSLDLLYRTVDLLSQHGFVPSNADISIAAQQPRLAPHIPAMRLRLAEAMKVSEGRVSIKATTTEGMGFEGRGEGISARAVVLIHIRR